MTLQLNTAENSDAGESVAEAPIKKIGHILLDAGKINSRDGDEILVLQKQSGLRFGEAAVKLKIISQADLDEALASQFSYPYLHKESEGFSSELVAAYKPFGPQVEAFRALRSQLIFRRLNAENRAIAITSPGKGEGRSYMAANLAVVFSQLGQRTLLIDADLRAPRQHTIFNLDDNTGLVPILAGMDNKVRVQHVAAFKNLWVLPAGTVPPNPQELLSRDMLSKLLDKVTKTYEVVLIDTPAGKLNSDAEIIAARAGRAVIVARKGDTPLCDAKRLSDNFVSVGVDVVGSVLNEF